MQKKGILVLLVLLFIAVMIGCKAESQPQDEAPQATESNQAEQSAPIESDEPAAKVGEAQPMAALVEVTQQELALYFETAYDAGQCYADLGYDEASLIEQELKELSYFVEDGISKWPDDVYDQYRAWREVNHPKEPEATEAPASNPQTNPIQQAPSTTSAPTSGGNVDTGETGGSGGPKHADTTQSDFFKIPDDPWSSNAKIDYGGTGGNVDTGGTGSSEGPKHDDPTQSSVFEPMDDPWDTQAHIKGYGGN